MNYKRVFVLIAVAIVLLMLTATVASAGGSQGCDGLMNALDNISPDNPGYDKVLELLEKRNCGAAQDHLALIAFHEQAQGPSEWTDLDSDHCYWIGVTCNEEGRVFHLSFYGGQLTGTIAPELGNLTYLQGLVLQGNDVNGLTGPIPSELGSLRYLSHLDLSHNLLTGVIPDALVNIGSLSVYNAFPDYNGRPMYLHLNGPNMALGCWESSAGHDWANSNGAGGIGPKYYASPPSSGTC